MRLSRLVACASIVLMLVGHPVAAGTVFTDMAPGTGTDLMSYGRGSVMVDFNGDGLLDLITADTDGATISVILTDA